MTLDEAKNLVVLALSNYPNMQDKNMRPTAVLWQQMLGDLPYDLVRQAVTKTLITAKYFPTVAEIREAAQSLNKHDELPTTEAAWTEVLREIERCGAYKAPQWSNSLIGEAVRVLGFRNLIESDRPGVDRAHFFQVYKQLAERKRSDEENVVVLQIVGNTVKMLR